MLKDGEKRAVVSNASAVCAERIIPKAQQRDRQTATTRSNGLCMLYSLATDTLNSVDVKKHFKFRVHAPAYSNSAGTCHPYSPDDVTFADEIEPRF